LAFALVIKRFGVLALVKLFGIYHWSMVWLLALDQTVWRLAWVKQRIGFIDHKVDAWENRVPTLGLLEMAKIFYLEKC
jgi:hypothetical protein